MSVVPKFSVTFKIGGKNITLSSSDLPDNLIEELKALGETDKQKKFKEAIKGALSFKLPEGQTVSVSVKELFDWLGSKGFEVDAAQDIFNENDIIVITAFSISAKGEFEIALKLTVDLDLPSDLEQIIDVSEVGFGLAYYKEELESAA